MIWDGESHQASVLGLLEYISIQNYENICENYFLPLENAIINETVHSKLVVLRYYRSLVRHWGSVARATTLETSLPLLKVVGRAELLSLAILETGPTNLNDEYTEARSAELSILQFYMVLAEVFSHAPKYTNIRLTVPSAPTIYLLVLTPALGNISLLGSILAAYKSAFEESLSSTTLQNPSSSDPLYPTETVAQFNGYVMDICNLLWRNRGFNTTDPNALGCLIPAELVRVLTGYLQELNDGQAYESNDGVHKYQISTIFSLSQNPALSGFSAACFQAIEDHANENGQNLARRLTKPVTQKALANLDKEGGLKINWQDYRLRILDWMDENGSLGIGELMRNTMKALRK